MIARIDPLGSFEGGRDDAVERNVDDRSWRSSVMGESLQIYLLRRSNTVKSFPARSFVARMLRKS